MIDLLKKMIEASKEATLPLDMAEWHGGTASLRSAEECDKVLSELETIKMELSK